MEDDEKQVALARALAQPELVARAIDDLPDPGAMAFLRAWRTLTFGPPPNDEQAANAPPESPPGGADQR